MDKTCGTCSHGLRVIVLCNQTDMGAALFEENEAACKQHQERTDSVEQVAREWALWCGEFDLDAVHFTDRLADLGFDLEASGVEV